MNASNITRHLGKIAGLMLAVCLTSLTSCGSDDEPNEPAPVVNPDVPSDVENVAVVFAGDLSEAKAVTRAALNDDGGPSSFKVWGYKNDGYNASTQAYTSYQTVMDGYRVIFESGTGATGWDYIGRGEGNRQQTIKYWDYSARAYRYMAYAPANAQGVTVTTGGNPATATMTMTNIDGNNPDTAPYVSEIWFSNGNAVLYPDRLFGKTIQMKFFKPFARVRFMFTFSESVKYYDRTGLSDISFAPIDGSKIGFKGTVAIICPLTGTETLGSFTSTVAAGAVFPDVADALTVDYTTANPHWYTVLPATQGDYRLTVKVLGEERTAEVSATMMQWKPGYEYTYVFKVMENGSVVLDLLEMAIHDWTVGTPRNHNFYNW